MIAAHIARNGVSRTVDWGPHAALVAALQAAHCDVGRTRHRAAPWKINDKAYTTRAAYAYTDKLRAKDGLKPLKLPEET